MVKTKGVSYETHPQVFHIRADQDFTDFISGRIGRNEIEQTLRIGKTRFSRYTPSEYLLPTTSLVEEYLKAKDKLSRKYPARASPKEEQSTVSGGKKVTKGNFS